MHRICPVLAAALVLMGCKQEETIQPVGELLDLSESVGMVVSPSIGPAPHESLVRSVNSMGAGVTRTPQELTLDGMPQLVNVDGWGYGGVVVEQAGNAALDGVLNPSDVYASGGDWAGFGLLPAQLGRDGLGLLQRAGGGALAVLGDEVWWVGPGLQDHVVLRFDGQTIEGARTAHIDNDGVLDALVWSSSTLVALKGRAAGGFGWGAGWTSDTHDVRSAMAADLDGDDAPDLAIAWGGAADIVEVFHGDGVWNFRQGERQPTEASPISLAIGDNDGSGAPQITVLMDNRDWQRFKLSSSGALLPTGPTLNDRDYDPQSEMFSGFDSNADGADNLIVVAPLVPGLMRAFELWSLSYGSYTYMAREYLGAHLGGGDGLGDGLGDIWVLPEDQELIELTWDGEGNYRQQRLATLPEHGPIALSSIDDDALADLLLAGGLWTWWRGEQIEMSDDWLRWTISQPSVVEHDLDMHGPIAGAEVDGNMNSPEVISFELSGGNTRLRARRGDGSLARDVQLDSVGSTGLDLAVCDGLAWALTETHLHVVDLLASSNQRLFTTQTTATRVDCGRGPSGSVGALLLADEVQLFDASFAEVGREPASGTSDLALANIDGADTVYTCSGDCAITRWAYGASGEHLLALAGEQGLSIAGPDGDVVVTGGGLLVTSDVDGDGLDDLITGWGEGYVGVYLSSGQGFGPGRYFHGEPRGSMAVSDADGDGSMDLFFAHQGDLVSTVAP